MQLNVVLKQERKWYVLLILYISEFSPFLDSDVVSAVAWSPDCQLMSCADDKILCKWGPDGDMLGKITSLTAYATSISWLPAVGKQVSFDVT